MPLRMLTPAVFIVGLLSQHASDAAYVVLIPLAALAYAEAGRHPMLGIAVAYAGISGAFAGNVVPGQLDVLLLGITQSAARLIDPGFAMNPLGNWWFTMSIGVLFTPIAWFISDRIVEPRFGALAARCYRKSRRLHRGRTKVMVKLNSMPTASAAKFTVGPTPENLDRRVISRRPSTSVSRLREKRVGINVCTKGVVCAVLATASSIAAADAIPMEAFFSGMRIQDAAISPDGQKLALTTVYNGREAVLVRDVVDGKKTVPVLAADARDRTHIKWCGWANETRLLCGMSEMRGGWGGSYYPITRLVAINADGSDRTMLTQESDLGSFSDQDNLIDWTPDDPKSILLQFPDSRAEFPSVFAVDVYSGKRRLVTLPHEPIVSFRTDGLGHVRLGFGLKDPYFSFYARINDDKEWRLLSKVEGLSRETTFVPIAVMPGTNYAYAIKPDGDLDALWKIDLTDTAKPEVIFEHPAVDVLGAVFTPTRRLIGVRYDTDRPAIYYADGKTREVMAAVQGVLPDTFNRIVDMSRDEQTLVVKSEADIKPPTYYLVHVRDGAIKLGGVGFAYPGLKGATLATMRFIQYPAKDGTAIPGYLTTPAGMRAEKLPLIVLPHGGPTARDTWGFDSWVQFLASRGYAVLQMNFRGSSGYGENWYWRAHQDWGGLTYSDIVDGARWAIDTGVADPKRVCIVGASFGGYAALLGATRNSDLFRCAVSIAGVSDLVELAGDTRFSIASTLLRKQFSPDKDKLKEDSPRRHAKNVNIPVLLIHGEQDYTVRIEHTYMMESALKQADKRYKTVIMKDNDHYFRSEADVRTLFTELEIFLRAELGPGAGSVESR